MSVTSSLTEWDAGARQCVIEADQLLPGFSWGTYNGHHPRQGLAADAMVPSWSTPAGRRRGQELADWIWVNRARLGIWYVIFDGRIISTTRPEQGWIRYFDADSQDPSRSHKNHVHVSWKSAPAISVVWTDRLVSGVTNSDSVRLVQRALGIPQTGAYDAATLAAATAFQASLGDTRDGELGPLQTIALLNRAKIRATIRTDSSGAVDQPVPSTPPLVVQVVEYPMPTSGRLYLDRINQGVTNSDTVAYLQTWLAMALGISLPRTGDYDAATLAAATRFQRDVLRDNPEFCDGILGLKQVIALATKVGATNGITIWRDSSAGGSQLWPKPNVQPRIEPTQPEPVRPRITVAGLNVLRRTDRESGKKRLTWRQRLPGLIDALKSARPDLVLLQELDKKTAADIANGLGSGWFYHRERGIGVMWRQDVLERADQPISKLYSDNDNRYVTSVPLRHKASGLRFWADVTHLENESDPNTDGPAARRLQTREFCAATKNGARIMGADLNDATAARANPNAEQAKKPRPMLAAANWTLLSQVRTTVPNGKLKSHWGGRKTDSAVNGAWIDDLGAKGDIRIISGRLIRTDPTRCSDHHLLAAECEL